MLGVPAPLLLVVVASVVIPAISAAVTKLHWDKSITGVITALLSAAAGFFTEWGNAGDGFAWKTAALTALASWLVACAAQARILSGTALEAKLLLLGSGVTKDGEPDPTVNVDPATGEKVPDPLMFGTAAPEQTPASVAGPAAPVV